MWESAAHHHDRQALKLPSGFRCPVHSSGSSYEFIHVLRDNLLFQHVDFPTRGRGLDSPHVLDLVITNKDIVETVDHLAPLGK